MRVGWSFVALLLLLTSAQAADEIANPTTGQHLSDSQPREVVEVSGARPGDEGPLTAGEVDRRRGTDLSGDANVALSELAPDPDWSLHERACECSKCCAAIEFYGPLPLASTQPPQQMFLTPVPDSASVLEKGRGYYRVDLDASSIIVRELDSGIIADYDLETWRLTVSYARGISDHGEVYASLPLISRTAGVMDGVIRSWHTFFSLPNALRDTLPDDQHHYVIVTRDGPVLNGTEGSGLGDITVGYKHRLWDRRDGRDAMAMRAAVKLPTGDSGQYFSSGAVDASLGLLWQRQLRKHLRAYANYDYVYIGDPGLENIVHQDIQSVMLGAEYAVSHRTTLQGLYQAQTNPLRIGSREADKSPQQIALGFAHRIGGRTVWMGSFTEDIYPETAPDFVLSTSLKWEF